MTTKADAGLGPHVLDPLIDFADGLRPALEPGTDGAGSGVCFCGDGRYSVVLSGEYYRLGAHDYKFSILKCKSCGLARTLPIPDSLQYDAGFSLTTKEGRFVGSTEDEWSPSVAREVANRAKGRRLIDIGCHVGNLVHAASELGFDAYGIDLDPVATAAGSQLGRAVENRSVEQVGDSFDVAVLVHVLEHVHELRTFLVHLERLLIPGGLAFVYVPYYRGLVARIMRENWMGWFPQQHVWHFTPSTLIRTVEGATRLRVMGCTTRGVIEPPASGTKGAIKAAISAFSRSVEWGDEIEAVFEKT
jgi:SAM-dependent methyltransferase